MKGYILNRREIIETDFMSAALAWDDCRQISVDEVAGITISTIFLSIDHGFGRTPKPILFETMIFNSDCDFPTFQRRYSSLEDAEDGHVEAVAQVKQEVDALGSIKELIERYGKQR